AESSATTSATATTDKPVQTALVAPDAGALEAGERGLNLSRDQRQRLQRALSLLGFDTQGVDGAFGARTRQSIAAWQASEGSPATGFLDATTYKALLTQAAPQLAAWDKAEAERRAEEALRQEQEARDAAARKAVEDEKNAARQQALLSA